MALVLFALLSTVRLGFGFERLKLPLPGPRAEDFHHEGITRVGAGVRAGGSSTPTANGSRSRRPSSAAHVRPPTGCVRSG